MKTFGIIRFVKSSISRIIKKIIFFPLSLLYTYALILRLNAAPINIGSVCYNCDYDLGMKLSTFFSYLLVSEHSERDTYRDNTIENRGYLFVYIYGRMYVIFVP